MLYFPFFPQERQKNTCPYVKNSEGTEFTQQISELMYTSFRQIPRYREVLVRDLNSLTSMAAVIGEDCRDRLQRSSRLSPCSYQTEEASAGKCCQGLSSTVIHSRAPDSYFQKKLEEGFCR